MAESSIDPGLIATCETGKALSQVLALSIGSVRANDSIHRGRGFVRNIVSLNSRGHDH
jgi:hypothetical protein